VCSACREPYFPNDEELREIGVTRAEAEVGQVFRPGPGCPQCKQTGYRGRAGIHELLVIDDDVRGEIMKNADAATIRRQATARGMATLRADGARKVVEGLTTIEEVLRVTQEDLAVE
jgi:general secretion pathway protein E